MSMTKQFVCRKLLQYDVDLLSFITSTLIMIPFTIEVLLSLWQPFLLSACIGIAVIVLEIILWWLPMLGRNYDKTCASLDYDDGEQLLLRVWARLICDHLTLPGYLAITNRRIVFVGKDSKKESVLLGSIISVEGRCRFLGIERWVKIVTKDRNMLVAVNYPGCLRWFITSIIPGLSSE
jgi:hypothetical protein